MNPVLIALSTKNPSSNRTCHPNSSPSPTPNEPTLNADKPTLTMNKPHSSSPKPVPSANEPGPNVNEPYRDVLNLPLMKLTGLSAFGDQQSAKTNSLKAVISELSYAKAPGNEVEPCAPASLPALWRCDAGASRKESIGGM